MSWSCARTVVSSLLLLAAAAAAPARADEIFRLDEVRPGQRGHGVSVFSGGEPERFEVEVVGVLRNVTPGASYLLARLSGRDLEHSGVVAGMSGSPVWIEGRLAGAVSFGFVFGKDPLAGITPIEAMRAIPRGSAGPGGPAGGTIGGHPAAARRASLADLAGLRLPAGLLDAELAGLARLGAPAGLGVPALLWTASGFAAGARSRLESALAPLGTFGTGGSGAPAAPAASSLREGAAVAGLLVDGDLQLAATGTVTERQGDELLAFGHPFLGIGETALPMATAEVVTVVASQASSFKLANTGPVVGAFVFDQSAGVRGRIGAPAPQVPLAVRVGGPAGRSVALRLADLPPLFPALLATGTLGALDAAAAIAAQSLDVEAAFSLADGRSLRMRQSFDGAGAAAELLGWLVGVSSYLTLNPMEEVALAGVELAIEPSPEPRGATLLGVRPDRAVARPGERLTVEATLAPYRGAPVRHRLALTLPSDLPAGRYSLLVGDGASVDGARLEIEPVDPLTLDQALAVLGSLASRRELAVLGVAPSRGVAAPGETLSRLPGTWHSLRGLAAGRTDERPLRLAVLQRERLPLDAPLLGLARVEIEIRRQPVLGGKEKP